MTYTQLKEYANEKYRAALQDHEHWTRTYGTIDKSLEYRANAWKAATLAKSKEKLIARIKMAAYTTEELKFTFNL